MQFSTGRTVESVYAGPLNSEGKAETERFGHHGQHRPNQKGLMIFERGHGRYLGSWLAGRYHGLGHYSYKMGISYEGGFADGLMHGHGKFCWPSTVGDGGITFLGEFERD